MEATELRVSNFVLSKNGKEFYLTQGRLSHYLANQHLLERLKGIPITEEWLERLGFVKSPYWDGGYIFLKDSLYLEQRFYLGSWITYLRYGRDVSQKHKLTGCKHVHQIQNLYHALTGKELEIKNK